MSLEELRAALLREGLRVRPEEEEAVLRVALFLLEGRRRVGEAVEGPR